MPREAQAVWTVGFGVEVRGQSLQGLVLAQGQIRHLTQTSPSPLVASRLSSTHSARQRGGLGLSPGVLPTQTRDLPFQGLEGAPPLELQLLHECNPRQVSLERLPGPEGTSPLPSLFPFKSPFLCLEWEWGEGILLGFFGLLGRGHPVCFFSPLDPHDGGQLSLPHLTL